MTGIETKQEVIPEAADITDQQRRRLAERLREMAYERPRHNDVVTDAELLCILGVGVGDVEGCAEPHDLYHLADLIDRPTCRVLRQVGNPFGICSNCGKEVFADADEPSGYCPECGAGVV